MAETSWQFSDSSNVGGDNCVWDNYSEPIVYHQAPACAKIPRGSKKTKDNFVEFLQHFIILIICSSCFIMFDQRFIIFHHFSSCVHLSSSVFIKFSLIFMICSWLICFFILYVSFIYDVSISYYLLFNNGSIFVIIYDCCNFLYD